MAAALTGRRYDRTPLPPPPGPSPAGRPRRRPAHRAGRSAGAGGGGWTGDLAERLAELLVEYRGALLAALEGASEQEARSRPVPSATTLLGRVEHVTHGEGVWSDQAVTGRTGAEIGIAASPHRSFLLARADTVARVFVAYRARAESSRRASRELQLSAVVAGRGDHAVWSLYLQVLRELAQHAGHADVLREQLLARRDDGAPGRA